METSKNGVVGVRGREVLRRNWMFKLVGKETFHIGKHKGVIHIEAVSGFAYEYTLEIDEKDTMDVWCDGEVLDTAGEFVEGGSETHFEVGGRSCCIRAVSSGKRREGIIHSLLLDDREIPEAIE
ncbi:Fas apoptotic inhibitory molecule 1 [Apostichopus japonicus]|uniref:Fas apoptotic inhibitory molecule 1 n=1 Tax=Stichopus japonicus TaxID=307972 RepID=A0A2G8KP01_STIJA|nr:Fas apoptotic inhibitory molecule 1 [Apostichopus japonicus]